LSRTFDVVILGSGPAGYTAALYAARANLRPALVEGWQPGGQLTITTDVENYPGFEAGILGPELMQRMGAQAERFGTEIIAGEAEEVDFTCRPFRVRTDSGVEVHGRTVIIATGASAKLLDLPSEKKFMGFGVSACATCDGAFFKNKRIVVVGGGDTAMEEAIYLTRFGSEVVVVHRRDTLRASKIMQERAFQNAKIRFIWDTEVAEVLGTNDDPPKVTAIMLRNLKTGNATKHEVDGVFIAIGHEPNTRVFVGKVPMDERGYLVVRPGTTKTEIPGVFAAGDVMDPSYRQAVTAAGTGCMAAIDAERFLAHEAHSTLGPERDTATGSRPAHEPPPARAGRHS
jgi:thioredoxin reductase (NADPH)